MRRLAQNELTAPWMGILWQPLWRSVTLTFPRESHLKNVFLMAGMWKGLNPCLIFIALESGLLSLKALSLFKKKFYITLLLLILFI